MGDLFTLTYLVIIYIQVNKQEDNMSKDTFTEEEITEAAYLAEADSERTKPKPKKSVKTFINPVQFKSDVSVNIADLDDAFTRQASLFAHYGMQAARASEQVDNLKLLQEVKEAQLSNEHRESLLAEGGKVTEKMIDSAVLTDPRYIKIRKAYNEAKGVLEMNKASTEAFRQRRDMLIQIGADAREEKKGEIFIKKKESQSGDLRGRTRRMKNG